MVSKKTLTLFHGSDTEFDRFERCGVRSTSALGIGYYLTPRLEKANRYGDIVMAFEVDVGSCLDWNDLSGQQRHDIEQFLSKYVPATTLAKYGETKYEVVPLNSEGLLRVKELQSLTASNDGDAAKAKMVASYDLPDHLKGIDRRKQGVVRWKEVGSLSGANVEQLLALAQEYAPEIASHLGYDGAMFGDEVSIYRSELAVKVGVLKEDAKYELDLQNKKGFWAIAQEIAKEEMQDASKTEDKPECIVAPKQKNTGIGMRF